MSRSAICARRKYWPSRTGSNPTLIGVGGADLRARELRVHRPAPDSKLGMEGRVISFSATTFLGFLKAEKMPWPGNLVGGIEVKAKHEPRVSS
jgi:hypothetical protein